MNVRRSRIQHAILIAAIIFTPFYIDASSYACEESQTPDGVFNQLSGKVTNSINANLDKIKGDPTLTAKLIEDALFPRVDIDVAAENVLAFEWDNLSDNEKDSFKQTFKIFLVRHSSIILTKTLLKKHKKLNDQDIRLIEHERRKDNTVIVKTRVRGYQDDIAYWLNCDDASWMIYDVSFNGISVTKTYKGQFEYKINRDGFSGLIAYLNHVNDILLKRLKS